MTVFILYLEQEGSNLSNTEKQPNLGKLLLDPCLVYLHKHTTTLLSKRGCSRNPSFKVRKIL